MTTMHVISRMDDPGLPDVYTQPTTFMHIATCMDPGLAMFARTNMAMAY